MSKKTQILTAALEMFGSQGFHETKIKEIAIKAGVGKGTVYEYYSSKSELLKESIYFALKLYLETLEDIHKEDIAIEEKFKAIVAMELESSKYQMNLMHNILRDQDFATCEMGDYYITFKMKRREVLAEMFNSISNHTDSDMIQMMITGTTNQFIIEKTMMNNPMTIDQFTQNIFEMLKKL